MCYHWLMEWPPLAVLDEAERQAVVAMARPRSFAKDDVVFLEGDPADSVHFVTSGHFAVRVSTPDGERATLNVLCAGGWFGELSLLHEQEPTSRSATVLALDDCSSLVLTQQSFHDLCSQHPRVERLVLTLMAARVRELSTQLLEAMYVPLDRRLCNRLLDLVEVYDGDGDRTVLPLTQEQIADLVGGTRPSVNQALQRLVAEGIVELGRGRVVVLDRATLLQRAGR